MPRRPPVRKHSLPSLRPGTRKPRIWLVNLFFGNGAAPTGVLLESVARGLEEQAWQVEVVAGTGRYNASLASSVERFTGTVHLLPGGALGSKGLLGRLLSWVFFFLGVLWFAFTRPVPDTILVMTTPPLLHAIFVLRNLLSRRQAKIILWNQDTYPEILAAVGLLRKTSWAYRLLAAVQRASLAGVTAAIVLDSAMADLLQKQGARTVRVIPNWESDGPRVAEPPLALRLRQARQRYRYLILYTGNYGWGHDLSLLKDYLRQEPRQQLLYFLFIGGGEKWPELLRLREELQLDCLEVHPYLPREQARALWPLADFGLVALERGCLGLMSPSKIHGSLAAGVPLLYLGPRGSNVEEAITAYRCGFQIDEDDVPGWQAWLRSVSAEDFDHAALARNATRAAAARYREEICVKELISVLDWAVGRIANQQFPSDGGSGHPCVLG